MQIQQTQWQNIVLDYVGADSWQRLDQLIKAEEQQYTIYPPSEHRFAALQGLAPEDVRVVILGQDPYHGPNQAHGLSFSVLPNVTPPPSLKNIYKELAQDTGFIPPEHGYLQYWASQGVLLLNSVLTVRAGEAGSHQKLGWEQVTDGIVRWLGSNRRDIVFMLWGSYAQKKASMVPSDKHLLLHAPHPSPLSAHRGFFGCEHFSKANAYLVASGYAAIDWQLPQHIDIPKE